MVRNGRAFKVARTDGVPAGRPPPSPFEVVAVDPSGRRRALDEGDAARAR